METSTFKDKIQEVIKSSSAGKLTDNELAEAKGFGVVSLGSKMIDPPVVKRALRIIKLTETFEERG